MPLAAKGDLENRIPDLGISPEKVRFIIVKAREFDVKEAESDPGEGSDAIDDGMTDVLEDDPENDAVQQELTAFINGMDVEEQTNLVALAWLGRGTYDIEDWPEALDTAKAEHNSRTAQYLLGLPLLGDYLAEGLEAFGESYDDETDEEFDAEKDEDEEE